MPINTSSVRNMTDIELIQYVDVWASRIVEDPDMAVMLLRILVDRLEALRDQMAGEIAHVR